MWIMKTNLRSSLFRQAKEVIAHGVNSNFRYWGDEDTLIIDRGEGAYIWDVDGKRYIDYVGSWGPLILGHAHPRVAEALKQAVDRGTSYGAPSPLETELAQLAEALQQGLESFRALAAGLS